MNGYNPQNPMIVQGDMSILLETTGPLYVEARDALARFAELEKSPDYIHTYRITALSLWNAAAAGMSPDEIKHVLTHYAKYPVPESVITWMQDRISRYGRLKLIKENGRLILVGPDKPTMVQIQKYRNVKPLLKEQIDPLRFLIDDNNRGPLKQALIKVEFPVEDLAGYTDGAPLDVELVDNMRSGRKFGLRNYQSDAAEIFYAAGGVKGGSGVLVLPCGAGKTVIGIASMSRVKQRTLILTTNITALRQWKSEILDKTTLKDEDVGEYSGEIKEIRPVTITTYQLMTYRKSKTDEFVHMDLFNAENWGLIIYDEVHMLPAPVFRSVANIQARRRLGLTATLVREDGLEDDVFSLIGPKKFDVPWKSLESDGWIAKANCIEVRVPLPQAMKMEYATADQRDQFRMASENPLKIAVVERLIKQHNDDNILIIGQYITQLEMLSAEFKAPIITGKTPNKERQEIYDAFKKKKYKVIIVSKVANFAIDLPDANVAIQVSGTFGSRQEEAQRLGRVLRPKGEGIENIAHFYSLTTKDTNEQEFANKRQRFLAEQGYNYRIEFEEVSKEAEQRAVELWEQINAIRAARAEEENDEDPAVVKELATK
ncbi:helicase-associated domain-containing protein [Candidatus Sumerlaeota bacterium]|nr:helicase-associated domain-containing protein [Candidatus Sumerlaeota bacterium]